MEKKILSLMKELGLQQICVSYQICQEGPNGPDIIDKELMIYIGSAHGAVSFMANQEFVWGNKRDKLNRLKEILGVE